MKASGRRSVLAVLACSALSLGRATVPPPLRQETPSAVAVGAAQPTAGERWLAETRNALDAATAVEVPFARQVVASAEGVPAAFAFEAFAGQTLELTLVREPLGTRETGIYVEVFRVIDVLGHALHQRLSALRPNSTSLSTRLPSDGTYHVLVQSSASGTGGYRLTLELGRALPFPVVGAHADSVRGLFGASRDAGKRHHQGVDIFVQRLTPVLAVAAGSVMPREDALGGKSVWLNTPGTSYYYAHLDRVAVREQQQVRAGDVLGYVGNTGNAKATPSHLHFGVYRWGREPINPLPLLVGQRFDAREPPPAAEAGG
jgi:murein DD-endopeptidase MepM/ murein hydrolase activator NlpD